MTNIFGTSIGRMGPGSFEMRLRRHHLPQGCLSSEVLLVSSCGLEKKIVARKRRCERLHLLKTPWFKHLYVISYLTFVIHSQGRNSDCALFLVLHEISPNFFWNYRFCRRSTERCDETFAFSTNDLWLGCRSVLSYITFTEFQVWVNLPLSKYYLY